MLRFYKAFIVLCAGLLLVLSNITMADSRGEQKQVFGDYEVHYIGLTSNFLSPETAQAYDIQRSRTMGFLSISVLDANKKNDLAVPVTAKVTGTIRNLIGQSTELEFKEIKETGSVYYISTFRFDNEDRYNIDLKVTPTGQKRSFDVKFSQQFYFEK